VTLRVEVVLAERDLEVTLEVADGEVLAVLGPNGAGKSTLLSVVAGLLRPDRGRVELDGRVLGDDAGTWVPPHDRGVALLAQEALLFPHLTARDNVAFGPRSAGRGRADSRSAADHWLAEVDAGDLADRRPSELSGGQSQRVALARALAVEPRLLLLDEPMAALDVAVAPALRQVLRRVLAGRSAVLVTHDVLDPLLLADRVVVLEDGRVAEQGPTTEVLARPRSHFAARIAGLNMVRGRLHGTAVSAVDGVLVEGRVEAPETGEGDAVAVFSPSAVAVFPEPPGGSPRNVLDVTVTELEPLGDRVRVRTREQISADVTPSAVAELAIAPGQRVCFVVKASEVAVYRV
jgi:molybdate transport system ATP-binding protein